MTLELLLLLLNVIVYLSSKTINIYKLFYIFLMDKTKSPIRPTFNTTTTVKHIVVHCAHSRQYV